MNLPAMQSKLLFIKTESDGNMVSTYQLIQSNTDKTFTANKNHRSFSPA